MVIGNFITGGTGLPRISGRMEQLSGGRLVARMAMAEYRAGTGGLTVTQLNPTSITVDSFGDALPDAVLIGKGGLTMPTEKITDGIAFWEALEGMRVTLDAPHVVSNTTDDQWRAAFESVFLGSLRMARTVSESLIAASRPGAAPSSATGCGARSPPPPARRTAPPSRIPGSAC